jgi:hypothetical protein
MPPTTDHKAIDDALLEWRQGDAVLEEVPFFLHLADIRQPLTTASHAVAAENAQAGDADGLAGVASNLLGIVVVSQTCDIVRSCANRPFVEVCALTEVSEQGLEDVRRLRRPAYAFLPGLSHLRLVADLDMTMTVEKSVLMPLQRVEGCQADAERRAFADALARKRARFAFPEDFVIAMGKVRRRLKERYKRDDPEGATARALMEIRVMAAPDWDADRVTLNFLFILADDEPPPTSRDEEQISDWIGRFDNSGRFKLDDEMPWRVCFLEDLDAATYVSSDKVDLDDLSTRALPADE